MKKILSVILALLLSLTMLTCVSAATSTDYEINKVEVDGYDVIETDGTIYVERDSTLDVDALLKANASIEDVKVKAWIGGYEYEDIEDVIGPFDIEDNVARPIHFKLAIPEDMDASETYTLYIEAYDGVDEFRVSHPIQIEEIRHSLKVQDVIFRPSSTVAPGEYLRAVVRVENMGDEKEEDIKVTLKVPELGISQRDYIDELVAFEDDEDDEEDSQSSNEIMVQIPDNAKAGDYEVEVNVEYNRGHDVVSKKSMIHVSGETAETVEAIISIDSTSKNIAQGSEVAYKLMFANLGENVVVYSASVTGTELWANARADPAFVTVQPGQTGELFVYLQAKDNADVGNKMFTVKINSGANTVKEITLNADVTETGSNWGGFKNVLEVIFGVLIILLVILGLVVAFKRSGPRGSEIEEPEGEQTYY